MVAISLIANNSTETVETITTVVEEVRTFTTTVVNKVKSFFSWVKKWVTKTVVTTVERVVTKTVKTYTPSITVNGEKIETKAVSVSEVKAKSKGDYYLAFADTTNNTIYMSSKISRIVAVAILKAGIKVPCIGNKNSEMIASTFTYSRADAYSITTEAGLNVETPYSMPHNEFGFYHYHSSTPVSVKISSGSTVIRYPHSFFVS